MFVRHDFLKLTRRIVLVAASTLLIAAPGLAQTDALPSWNDGTAKQSIVDFVTKVTKEGSPDFVPEPERIAVFDNDGTLWVEHPMYTQLAFALDRVKALAPQHPDWATTQPFQAALEGDMKSARGERREGPDGNHRGDPCRDDHREFETIVSDWLATARDPRFKRPYTELVYQPMLELLAYLRANGFKTFIASGGGIEFMRPWTEQVYGVPPEQVVGSSIKTQFEMKDGAPTLFRTPEFNFIDDKDGKPVGINEHIGRRPIAAFGNSDGDLEMLQWTTLAGGTHLGVSFITPTPSASTPTTGTLNSAASTRRSMQQRQSVDGCRHEGRLGQGIRVRTLRFARMDRLPLPRLLAATAFTEAATGIALMVVPSIVGRLLLDEGLSGAGLAVGRVAGVALLALGVGSWTGRHSEGRSAALAAMLTYNALAAPYLAYLAIDGALDGLLLWPAVAVHAALGLLLARAWFSRQPVSPRD